MKVSNRTILPALVCFSICLTIFSGCVSREYQLSGQEMEKLYADCKGLGQFTPIYNKVYIENDLSYLGPGRAEKFDLYAPADVGEGQRFPGIVIIHGGGWQSGDKDRRRQKNIGINLARRGYVCMSIDYLLADWGSPSWPENFYDCKRAVQFLRKNAERFSVDPDHIGVIGGSAGGHLAAMVGLTGPEVGLEPPGPYKGISSKVQAVVPMYGVHNLMVFDKQDDRRRGEKFLGATRKENPELWASASPVNHVSSDDPPFLILHGTADKIVRYERSVELHEKLRENGVDSRLVLLKDAPHSFDLQPIKCDIRPLVVGFFDEHLKGKTNTE